MSFKGIKNIDELIKKAIMGRNMEYDFPLSERERLSILEKLKGSINPDILNEGTIKLYNVKIEGKYYPETRESPAEYPEYDFDNAELYLYTHDLNGDAQPIKVDNPDIINYIIELYPPEEYQPIPTAREMREESKVEQFEDKENGNLYR